MGSLEIKTFIVLGGKIYDVHNRQYVELKMI